MQVATLSSYKVITLQGCQVEGCQVTRLPIYKVTNLQGCQIACKCLQFFNMQGLMSKEKLIDCQLTAILFVFTKSRKIKLVKIYFFAKVSFPKKITKEVLLTHYTKKEYNRWAKSHSHTHISSNNIEKNEYF